MANQSGDRLPPCPFPSLLGSINAVYVWLEQYRFTCRLIVEWSDRFIAEAPDRHSVVIVPFSSTNLFARSTMIFFYKCTRIDSTEAI